MTAKELIEILQQMPENTTILIEKRINIRAWAGSAIPLYKKSEKDKKLNNAIALILSTTVK